MAGTKSTITATTKIDVQGVEIEIEVEVELSPSEIWRQLPPQDEQPWLNEFINASSDDQLVKAINDVADAQFVFDQLREGYGDNS